MTALHDRRVLLIVSGGIAAFKALELVRLLKRAGAGVRCVLTRAGAEFVTPLSLQALSGEKVHDALWSLTDESEMGHIELSRSADLVVVAPASANLLARMATGMADDLASTLLLATDTPVLVAPAMNVRMWLHPATLANMALLRARGVHVVGPDEGGMACGEWGPGRLAEPPVILAAIADLLAAAGPKLPPPRGPAEAPPPDAGASPTRPAAAPRAIASRPSAPGPSAPGPIAPEPTALPPIVSPAAVAPPDVAAAPGAPAAPAPARPLPAPAPPATPLAGRHALVTAGPTHEPIDPVRYIANRSSGRQGFALAAALAELGARVTLVAGPVGLPDPPGVTVRRVETAAEMLDACEASLPADLAVCAAAVADWRAARPGTAKLKKRPGEPPPPLELTLNPDILATLSHPGPRRPTLVVGFAAETDDLRTNAAEKRRRKGCDWIVANDVRPETGIMGGPSNHVLLLTAAGTEEWPELPKEEVARRLAGRMAAALSPAGR